MFNLKETNIYLSTLTIYHIALLDFVKKNRLNLTRFKNRFNNKTVIFSFSVMVFNATFNNISVILWWSVLLQEETGGPAENYRPVASY